jgi:GLPGLI family protein
MRYLFCGVAISICFYTNAQMYFFPSIEVRKYSQDIDSADIRIEYVLNSWDSISKRDSCTDVHILEIGNNFSKYYSYNVFRIDSLRIDYQKRHPRAVSRPNFLIGTNIYFWFWSEYYKDFNKNVLREYAWMPNRVPNYWYSEDMHIQDWQIEEDTLTIAGYLCQKATCRFRGRQYTAWFAPDIPINNGPWKFGGLPGLILWVYDKDNHYVFECVTIKQYQNKFTIKTHDYSGYFEIKREKLLKTWRLIFDDYFKFTGSTVHKTNINPILPPKEPYRPLELEIM